MMEANRGGALIEWAGVGADHALAEIRHLQSFVAQIALDKFRHRPIEKQRARFGVIPEALFDLLARGCIADPGIASVRTFRTPAIRRTRTQRIAQPPDHIAHGVEPVHIAGSKRAHFFDASLVIVPKLDAGAIELTA